MRGLVVAVVLALLGWGGYETHGTIKAHALRDRLLDANTADVPIIVQDMESYRRWIDPLLRDAYHEAEVSKDERRQLHASLALLPADAAQVKYLYDRLLDAEPHEVKVIRDALSPHKDELLDNLWAAAEKPEKGKETQRLRAAAALATYDRETDKWAKVQQAVANDLVGVPAVYLATWLECFRTVRDKLLVPLAVVYRDAKRRETERSLATDILADYAADQPQLLADLLMDADDKQFAVLYPKVKEQGERGRSVLTGEIDRSLRPDAKADAREELAKRQANAAVALLRMNASAKVWPLLKHRPDPRARSYLIHRLALLGADARAIIKRLDEEPDVTLRRALLLSLGEFDEQELAPEARKGLLPKLQEMYRRASDPGLHAAAEWLLRSWQQEAWLRKVNEEWAKDQEQRQKRLDAIKVLLRKDKEKAPPQWYVNGQGQTMVVIPGPVEFLMGSPPTEPGRRDVELQHRRRIGRTFALMGKPVTLEQFQTYSWAVFKSDYGAEVRYMPTPQCPVNNTNWYQATAYCNWLILLR
jgi:hypothetical protein